MSENPESSEELQSTGGEPTGQTAEEPKPKRKRAASAKKTTTTSRRKPSARAASKEKPDTTEVVDTSQDSSSSPAEDAPKQVSDSADSERSPAASGTPKSSSEARDSQNPTSGESSPGATSSEDGDGNRSERDSGDDRRRQRKRFRQRRRGRFRERDRDDDFQIRDTGESLEPESNPADDAPMPENYTPVFEEGIVEVSGKGFGFLRDARCNYAQSKSDTFITPEVVRKHGLRDGMRIKGEVRRGNRGPQLFRLSELEGEDPEKFQNLPVFEELTTINPLERFRLETTSDRFTTRIIDLLSPIGKGQRGLIVAPPRTGKTTLLQHIAEAVRDNHPDVHLMILLVDERPEEVTEIRRALPEAELFASSNDDDTKSHTRIAQLAIDRARRLVEMGKDVFVVMDSLTRIGRAFNNSQSSGGRTMSGGVDSRALEIPRKLFASARNTEEAGSLTIIATALIETGSRMDELIFLEFKGTGNMELVLDRKISDQRIYPAADIFLSGTRREELLLPADDLNKISVIRRGLSGHKPIEAIERMLFFLKKYPTNEEMLANIPAA